MIDKIKTVVTRVTSNEGTLFTYAFAYSLIVGLAPFLIIAVVFVGNYVFSVDQIISLLGQYIPTDLILPFIDYITRTDISSISLVISLLSVSVWVASKSIYSFLLLSSEDDGFNFPHIFLRILSVVYFVLIVVALVSVGFIVSFLPVRTGLILPLLLFVFFLFFYRMLSFNRVHLKELMLGSLFTSVGLMVIGQLFFVYINRFSNYETIYGPLASFMILLISVGIISWVIFVGYSINLVFARPKSHEPLKLFDMFDRD